ncbi:hypothetical protein [Pelomonas sp. KK5]|uniref:hypothetical protein n=1 Tax=Pelomonas sp. KK5 TaxID=1855730 RepID=UPI00097C9597|nr:hypothetical protein [Pelomonas sp. KK5]
MSEKNLSEAEWKKFSKGRGLKDAALLKAFGALDGAKDAEARLAALAEVEKQADILRKAAKGDKEVASYLDDADKSLAKERKSAEADARKAAKENESAGEEDEESPALLTSKLLPLVKMVQKGEPMQALVALAGKDTAVMLSKRSISPARRKLMQDFLGATGGVKYAVGECIWEANAHTFVLQTQAAGLAKKLKAALLAQVGLRLKVRVRGEDPDDIDEDGEALEGMLEEVAPEAAATAAAEVPEAPPLQPAAAAGPDGGAAFNTRLAALMPRVKEALAAAGPAAGDLKAKIGEAGLAARNKTFDHANALLDQVEQLLDVAAAPATAPAAPAADGGAAFNTRLAALMPRVKEALAAAGPAAAELKAKIGEAGLAARNKTFDQANALLDQAEQLLDGSEGGEQEGEEGGGDTSPEALQWQARLAEVEARYLDVLKGNPADATRLRAVFGYAGDQAAAREYTKALDALKRLEGMLDAAKPSEDTGYEGLVEYRKTLLDYRSAAGKVKDQIAALKKAIPSQSPDEADLADELAEALGELNDDLLAMVDEAMNTSENKASPVTKALKAQVTSYLAELSANALVKHVDSNPYGVAVNIEQTLGAALENIRDTMPAPV